MAYIRSDIPSRQRKDLEPENSPCIIIEALLIKQKWCFVTYYNSPSTTDAVFEDFFSKTLDNVTAHYSNYVTCGDLNYDPTKKTSNALKEMCVLFGSYNLVKGPTCFKSKHGSLLDVILVNKSSTFYNTLSFVNFHNMVATMMRFHEPYKHNKYIQYRSFKNYNKINYTSSIENSQITKCKNVENTNHAWKLFSDCLKEVIEDHAPLKTKKVRPDQPPFMNTRLRKEI